MRTTIVGWVLRLLLLVPFIDAFTSVIGLWRDIVTGLPSPWREVVAFVYLGLWAALAVVVVVDQFRRSLVRPVALVFVRHNHNAGKANVLSVRVAAEFTRRMFPAAELSAFPIKVTIPGPNPEHHVFNLTTPHHRGKDENGDACAFYSLEIPAGKASALALTPQLLVQVQTTDGVRWNKGTLGDLNAWVPVFANHAWLNSMMGDMDAAS